MNTIPLEEKALKKAYDDACKERDETDKKIQPLKKKLEEAAAKAEEARVEAMKAKDALDKARGGPKWFDLKKRIAVMANIIANGKFAKGDGNGSV